FRSSGPITQPERSAKRREESTTPAAAGRVRGGPGQAPAPEAPDVGGSGRSAAPSTRPRTAASPLSHTTQSRPPPPPPATRRHPPARGAPGAPPGGAPAGGGHAGGADLRQEAPGCPGAREEDRRRRVPRGEQRRAAPAPEAGLEPPDGAVAPRHERDIGPPL